MSRGELLIMVGQTFKKKEMDSPSACTVAISAVLVQ